MILTKNNPHTLMDKGFKRNLRERDTKQLLSFCIPDFDVGNSLQHLWGCRKVDSIEGISKK
jgi:hypothetical protein